MVQGSLALNLLNTAKYKLRHGWKLYIIQFVRKKRGVINSLLINQVSVSFVLNDSLVNNHFYSSAVSVTL